MNTLELAAAVDMSLATAMRQADRLRKAAERDTIRVTRYEYSSEIISKIRQRREK